CTEPRPRTWWFDDWWPTPPEESPPTSAALFPVSHRTATASRGVTISLLAADGIPLTTRVEPQLLLQNRQELPSAASDSAEVRWAGALYAPSDGAYGFVLTAAGRARVWLDGQLVVSNDAADATRELAQGLHRI